MLPTKRDVEMLFKVEKLKEKWIETKGKLSEKEYEEVIKIRKYFTDLTYKGFRSKKTAKRYYKRFIALTFVANLEFFVGYFIALAEIQGLNTQKNFS